MPYLQGYISVIVRNVTLAHFEIRKGDMVPSVIKKRIPKIYLEKRIGGCYNVEKLWIDFETQIIAD